MNSIKIGRKFGYLTVIKVIPRELDLITGRVKGRARCQVKCKCGSKAFSVVAHALISGNTKSCGCLRLERLRQATATNLIGQIFGDLIVLKIAQPYIHKGQAFKCYYCHCICTNEVIVRADSLTSGNTSSCGCLKSRPEDVIRFTLIGARCGSIIITKFLGKARAQFGDDKLYWEYKCKCGNVGKISTGSFNNKDVESCGCIGAKKSKQIMINRHKSGLQKKIMLRRYGVEFPSQIPEVKRTLIKLGKARAGAAKIKRYQTNFKRYGVGFVTQNPQVALRAAISAGKVIKVKNWKSGKFHYCRGRWEEAVARYFNRERIPYEMPQLFSLVIRGKKATYTPDFYLTKSKLYIEVKGRWMGDARSKWLTFCRQYPTVKKEIWNKKRLQKIGISVQYTRK